ncbi:MAG: hypothetical protein ACFFC7_11895 [Candidatus Hermodarchaeota archaeon]
MKVKNVAVQKNISWNATGDITIDMMLLIEFFTDTDLGKTIGEQIINNEEIKGIYIHDYL